MSVLLSTGTAVALVQAGDPISASRHHNPLALIVNDLVKLRAPTSQDEGVPVTEAEIVTLVEETRFAQTVRIYQDGDTESENFVDVSRATGSILRVTNANLILPSGTKLSITWSN